MWAPNKKLDLLVQFADFVQLITNPKEFTGLVEEAKKQNQEIKSQLKSFSVVEEAEKYLAQATKTLEKAEQEAQAKREEVTAWEAKIHESADKMVADNLAKAQAVSEAAAKVSQQDAESKKVKSELDQLKVDLAAKEEYLANRELQLSALEQSLKEKQSKLNEILKG